MINKVINEAGATFKAWDNRENLTPVTVYGDKHGHGVRVWVGFDGNVEKVTRLGYTAFTKPTKAIEKYLSMHK